MALSKKQREMLQSEEYDARNKDLLNRSQGSENHCVKLPAGTSFFSFKQEGEYLLDIIGYFAGANNPDADEGHLIPFCVYWRHASLGPDNRESYRCMRRSRTPQPCYICEWMMKNEKSADPEHLKAIKPKERLLWNVIDLNAKDKGVQVLDNAPYKGLGDQLQTMLRRYKGKYDNYYNPLRGCTLSLMVEEEQFGKNKMKAVVRVDPMERKKQYGEDIYDRVITLDDCLLNPSYDDLRRAMGHGDDGGTPSRSTSRGVTVNGNNHKEEENSEEEDSFKVGDRVKHRQLGICTVVKVRDGRLTLEDRESEVHTGILAETVERADDSDEGDSEDQPQTPAKRKEGAATKNRREVPKDEDDSDDVDDSDDDDDDDEDDSEDEEESSLPRKQTKKRR